MSTLVTGADGMLGAWLVQALAVRGEQVVALRRHGRQVSALTLVGADASCTTVRGDLTDAGLLDRVIAEHEVVTVFHLAAQSLEPVAMTSPLMTFETNVRGTWLLLEACRIAGVRRVVVASSDRVYGEATSVPREDARLAADRPYDVSKAAADIIARSYWPSFGLPVAALRCTNVYGGADLNLSRLVPSAIAAALAGRAPAVRSDGTPQRDFLYVDDAVDAYLRIARALDERPEDAAGEAFNVGGDRTYSVREVVDAVCRLAGTGVAPDIRGAPAAARDRGHLDSSKLRALTDWAPRCDLDQGLRRTVDWYARHPAALARAHAT